MRSILLRGLVCACGCKQITDYHYNGSRFICPKFAKTIFDSLPSTIKLTFADWPFEGSKRAVFNLEQRTVPLYDTTYNIYPAMRNIVFSLCRSNRKILYYTFEKFLF